MSSEDFSPYIWVNNFEEADVRLFYEQFHYLELTPSIQEIVIFVNSFGGSVHGYLAMRSLIKRSVKPVATVVVGKAMSAGALLAASGTKGYRFAAPDSDIMIHEASLGVEDKNTEFQNQAKMLDRLNKTMLRCLGEDTKLSAQEWKDKLKNSGNIDLFLTPTQCKKMGIVDHVKLPLVVPYPSYLKLETLQNLKPMGMEID